MRYLQRRVLTALCLLSLTATAFAQAPASGWRAEVLSTLEETHGKYVQLARAMTDESMTWRPGEGVRSSSEVMLHLAMANFFIPSMMGVAPPEGLDRATYETSTTDADEIVKALDESFTHVKNAILQLTDDQAETPAKVFGQDSTYRGVLLLITQHNAEHLGQLIAYARVNGIVPPWSAEN